MIPRIRLLILVVVSFCISTLLHANSFKVQEWRTSRGARVIFYQTFEIPTLNINVAFSAGSARDGKHFGLCALTTSLLNQGNNGLKGSLIAERFANVGAQFSRESSRDMVVLALKTLVNPELLQPAIDTFSLVIGRPDFPARAFQREQRQQLVSINQQFESPNLIANTVLFERLYHDHPYGHPILGTENCVQNITRLDVRRFYERFFVASNAVIVLVGAIQVEEAKRIAELIVYHLPQGRPAGLIPFTSRPRSGGEISVPFPSTQTILRLGQIGITHASPEYFPLMVGNYILGGGGLVSRLSNEIREKRGLSYGVTSQLTPMLREGPFLISLSTETKQSNLALKVTKETLMRFITQGPDENELLAAKKYLTGSFPLSMADNTSIGQILLRMAFYNLPSDYINTYKQHINAVSTADIKRAFQSQVSPDKMLLVSVGKN